jgi:hypothetical protein
MLERVTSLSATSPIRRKELLAGISAGSRDLEDDLLKLRAVLILLAAPHGSKVATACATAAELRAKRLKASMRSIFRWQNSYLRFGFAGIVRRRRSDVDCPRRFGGETIVRLVDAATRVKRHGDLTREFRKLRAGICYGTFRAWVRRIRRQLKVIEMPRRGSV